MRRGVAETARARTSRFAKRARDVTAKWFKEPAFEQKLLSAQNEPAVKPTEDEAERSPPATVAEIGAASSTNTPQESRTGGLLLWLRGMGIFGILGIGTFCPQQLRRLDAWH